MSLQTNLSAHEGRTPWLLSVVPVTRRNLSEDLAVTLAARSYATARGRSFDQSQRL